MGHLTDDQLLQRFADHRDADAFGELARRHADLVHATCRREIGDEALAEDAAQGVFLLLAKKARALRGARLECWLFVTSRLVSRNVLRKERRWRESEAKALAQMERAMPKSNNETWEAIEPHFNEALARLKPEDQQVVLLRFLEGKSLSEVGAALGLGENTARMRVTRAVDRLRTQLLRAGITVSVATLTLTLERHAAIAAPPAFVTAVSVPSAVASGAEGLAWSVLAKATILTMATNTTKILAASGLALLLAGGGFVYVRASGPNENLKTFRAAFRPFVGKWKGQVRTTDPRSNRVTEETGTLEFTALAGGNRIQLSMFAPSQPTTQKVTLSMDPRSGYVKVEGQGPEEPYRVQGLSMLAQRRSGTLVMESVSSAGPNRSRVTLSLVGDRMTFKQEVARTRLGGYVAVVDAEMGPDR